MLKEAPPGAARKTQPIVAELNREYRTMPIPVLPITGPPNMNQSWLIKGAAQYLEKMKEETV